MQYSGEAKTEKTLEKILRDNMPQDKKDFQV